MSIFYNANITFYNKCFDEETEKDVYIRHYLYGVSWQSRRAITNSDKGVVTNNYADIFIKDCKDIKEKYLKPKEWLNSSNKDYFFTFKVGDVIVKGLTAFEFGTLKELKTLCDDVMIITSIEDSLDTSIPHIQIGAK